MRFSLTDGPEEHTEHPDAKSYIALISLAQTQRAPVASPWSELEAVFQSVFLVREMVECESMLIHGLARKLVTRTSGEAG